MAYNLLDLRSRVRTKIKDTSYSATSIDGFINDAIIEISDLFIWKQFNKVVEGTLTADDYTFEQQSDHQTTSKLVLIDPDDTTRYFNMTKYRMPWQRFFEVYPAPDTRDSGLPANWTEYGDQIYFNCPVDKAYKLRQFYQKIPTDLAEDADVPELPTNFREAIVLGGSYRCEEERGNYDIAGILQNRFNDRVSDLMTRFANDTLEGPDTVVMPGRRMVD
jgi:hypothetical protein